MRDDASLPAESSSPATEAAVALPQRRGQGARFFLIYLAGAALSVGLIQAMDRFMAARALCGSTPLLTVFGRAIECDKHFRHPLMTLIGLAVALLAEYCLLGPDRHSLRLVRARHRSAMVDLLCLGQHFVPFLMPLMATVLTLGVWFSLNQYVRAHLPPELNLFEQAQTRFGLPLTALLFVIYSSFLNYWSHRLMHGRVLWPIHRMHHSAQPLTPMTALRGNPAEYLLAPLIQTIPLALMGAPGWFMTYYLAFILYHEFIVHIGRGVHWGWISRYVWCAPVNHELHHSDEARHLHRNYSTTMPLWDRLFGSYWYEHGSFTVGLAEAPQYQRRSYYALLVAEMIQVLIEIKRTFTPAPSPQPAEAVDSEIEPGAA